MRVSLRQMSSSGEPHDARPDDAHVERASQNIASSLALGFLQRHLVETTAYFMFPQLLTDLVEFQNRPWR